MWQINSKKIRFVVNLYLFMAFHWILTGTAGARMRYCRGSARKRGPADWFPDWPTCGCWLPPNRRFPCWWCSGHWRSCWWHPDCRWPASPGDTDGDSFRCGLWLPRSVAELRLRQAERLRLFRGLITSKTPAPLPLLVGLYRHLIHPGQLIKEDATNKNVRGHYSWQSSTWWWIASRPTRVLGCRFPDLERDWRSHRIRIHLAANGASVCRLRQLVQPSVRHLTRISTSPDWSNPTDTTVFRPMRQSVIYDGKRHIYVNKSWKSVKHVSIYYFKT